MPELVVKLGDSIVQRYVIDKDLISIGRAKDNDIVIENLSVSRSHARIRRQGRSYILTDLNSANGTFVNNVRITKTEIFDGDVITIGKHRIEFIDKELSDSDLIVEALGAERTMVINRSTPVGVLCFTEGRLKGKTYQLTKPETTIGKSPQNDIVIAEDWFLAKKQAVIVRRGQDYELRDLGTLRKTRVNGRAVSGTHKLAEGDILEFGSEKCLFKLAIPQEMEGPAGRVPKELGLEDSIFASVSELPPELRPNQEAAGAHESAPSRPLDESEEWSDMAGKLEAEAAPSAPQPKAGIDLGDLQEELASRTFESADLGAQTATPPAQEEAPSGEPSEIEPPAKLSRLSRRKLRQLQAKDKQPPVTVATELATESRGEGGEVAAPSPGSHETPVPSMPEVEVVEPAEGDEGAPASRTSPASEQFRAGELVQDVGPETSRGTGRELTIEEQVALWQEALSNPSPVIRRQAAKMLKKLTGKDYAH